MYVKVLQCGKRLNVPVIHNETGETVMQMMQYLMLMQLIFKACYCDIKAQFQNDSNNGTTKVIRQMPNETGETVKQMM